MKPTKSSFLLCLVFIQIFASGVSGHSDKLADFLNSTMATFPDWLRENDKFDSAPLILDLSDKNNNLSCTVSNLALTPMTNLPVTWIMGDLLKGNFKITYCPTTLELIGDYKMNGTLIGNIPVTGSGKATIKYSDSGSCFYTGQFEMYGLKATPTGYIDVSQASSSQYLSLTSSSFTTSLDGLNAGGLEENVTQMFREKIARRYDHDDIFPVFNQTLAFFKQVFASTPISEIIGATTPPPTTTSTEKSSSEQPPPVTSSDDPSQPTGYPTRPTIPTSSTIETTTASGDRAVANFLFTILLILFFLY